MRFIRQRGVEKINRSAADLRLSRVAFHANVSHSN
jgi:hypothetical protein